MAWERGLESVGLPVLRLPCQLNVGPTTSSPRPRVVVCVSTPLAKVPFSVADYVERALDALEKQDVGAEAHVFADADGVRSLRGVLGGRAQVHDPREEGVHTPADRLLPGRPAR